MRTDLRDIFNKNCASCRTVVFERKRGLINMSKRRKRKQAKQLGQSSKNQIELTVTEARNWLMQKKNFSSSVRLLAREWGWGTNKVSTFLRKIEAEGVLTRTFGGAGKTQFEMVEILDDIPASLDQ